jgi:2-polyprenyl-6-methoxyphenol hydroxylase-like FAD-dependent oxidoreductase
MEDGVASLASVRVERGVQLVGLSQAGDDGYVLALAGPGGRRREVRARFVIGADGIRSTVRQQLGIATEGAERLAERLAVLFRASLWELVGEHRYLLYSLAAGPADCTLIPSGKPDRWLLALAWDAAVDDIGALTVEQARRWIRDAAGDPRLPVEIERWMPVEFGVALAERFREGNAFLIGDAAHRVTPRGGTGLNSAIRDGFDLGWKLAWVVRGWAGDGLLESYERERRPVAEFNARRSARSDGSLLASSFGLNADLGGRLAHVWLSRDGRLVSTLDLLGEGQTLFVGPDWHGVVSGGGAGSPPLAVERLDAMAARGLGLATTGALLARPDGHPAALWNDDQREVAAA